MSCELTAEESFSTKVVVAWTALAFTTTPFPIQCTVSNRSVSALAQHVKRRRQYDATKRRADALARRTKILDAAADLFERDWFALSSTARSRAKVACLPTRGPTS